MWDIINNLTIKLSTSVVGIISSKLYENIVNPRVYEQKVLDHMFGTAQLSLANYFEKLYDVHFYVYLYQN